MPFDSQPAADRAASPDRMERQQGNCSTLFHRPGWNLPWAGNCPGVERMPGPCSRPFHLHAPGRLIHHLPGSFAPSRA